MKFTWLVLIFILLEGTAHAQVQNINLIVSWDNNAFVDNVTSYTVTLVPSSGPPVPVQIGSPTLFCTVAGCQVTFTNLPPETYSATVVATNPNGPGPIGLATINQLVPTAPKNIHIKQG